MHSWHAGDDISRGGGGGGGSDGGSPISIEVAGIPASDGPEGKGLVEGSSRTMSCPS